MKRRARLQGLNPDRADTIVGGAVVVLAVMDHLGVERVLISSRGLREGLALGDPDSVPTPREVRTISVATLASRFATWDPSAAARRVSLSSQLVEALDLESPPLVKEMLQHAASLLDIGKAIDHYERWDHAAMIVTAADLAGFTHQGLVALVGDPSARGGAHEPRPLRTPDPTRRAPGAPQGGRGPRPRGGAAPTHPRRGARHARVLAAARPLRDPGARARPMAAEEHLQPFPCGVRGEARGRAGVRDSADPRRTGRIFGQTDAAAGNRIVNVVPRPSSLSTSIVPPWFSTTCFTIARPSPVPPVSRDRARSTR